MDAGLQLLEMVAVAVAAVTSAVAVADGVVQALLKSTVPVAVDPAFYIQHWLRRLHSNAAATVCVKILQTH